MRSRKRKVALYVAVAYVGVALLAAAAPAGARPAKPDPAQGSYAGQVAVRTLGQAVVVALDEQGDGNADRLFRVETYGRTDPALSLRAASAQVLFWKGHLVVIAPEQGRAIHFSLPGASGKSALPWSGERDRPRPSAAELDTLLGAIYDLARVDTATAIISRAGRLGSLSLDQVASAADVERGLASVGMGMTPQNQTPGGTGNGGCGDSCQISCRDGSSCSASCGTNRCASCTCPASCTCS